MGKRSRVYKVRNKLFQYDFDECIVYWVHKVTKEDEEWMTENDCPLFYPVNEDGYSDIEGVGLSVANWKDKEARNSYLEMWCDELDEESRILAQEFLRWG